MTTYELCKAIRRAIVNKTAEVMVYTMWDTNYALEQIRNLVLLRSNVDSFPIQPEELTSEEMDALDFGKWNEDNSMRLIPLWLFPFLTDEIKCNSIDGRAERVMKKSEIYTNHRFGCLAFGVIPRDKVKENKHAQVAGTESTSA